MAEMPVHMGGTQVDNFKYSYRNTRKESLSLAVYNTGYQRCDSGHSWGPALRDHYLIHYVTAGKGYFSCRGQLYTLGEGDIFLISPSELVSYAADRGNPWEYYWVGFHGTEAKRLLNLAGFSKESPVLRVAEPNTLKQLLLRIYEARGNTPAADAEMVGHLYLFFSELIRHVEQQGILKETIQYLEQAVRFVQFNYAGDIGVTDMAAYAGVSRSQLYRAFQSGYGLSPHDFLQRYRIGEACSLLQSHRFTVAEVAGSVGFNDPLYFSRIFKKMKGLTPTEYQKIQEPDAHKGTGTAALEEGL